MEVIAQQKTVSNRKIQKSPYVLDSDQGALNKTLDSVFNNPDSTTGWIVAEICGAEGQNRSDTTGFSAREKNVSQVAM